jgi:hypothetical protein
VIGHAIATRWHAPGRTTVRTELHERRIAAGKNPLTSLWGHAADISNQEERPSGIDSSLAQDPPWFADSGLSLGRHLLQKPIMRPIPPCDGPAVSALSWRCFRHPWPQVLGLLFRRKAHGGPRANRTCDLRPGWDNRKTCPPSLVCRFPCTNEERRDLG